MNIRGILADGLSEQGINQSNNWGVVLLLQKIFRFR